MVLNPNKTKYLIFGSRFQLNHITQTVDVLVADTPVERVYEARNLGLIMDCDLRFHKHVINCVQNCFYKLKILYNIRPFLTEELRITLVESLVLSKLNYMDVVFGPRLLAKTQNLIQRVQNACARFCFNIPFRSHVTPFLNKYAILKMKHRRKLHLACLLFGVLARQAPAYLYTKLSKMSNLRSCASRRCTTQLAIQQHKTVAFKGSFRYASSKCWNNIPPPIRNLQNIISFRNRLKLFLLQHQKGQEMLKHETSAL